MFFVISGFLITSLLLKDSDLKKFYFRRTLRIFPPYYVYLMIFLILALLGWVDTPYQDLLASFTYTENYFYTGHEWNLVLHAWSLAVEEQFYLILPFMMMWTKKPIFPILAIVLCPIIRFLYISNNPSIWIGFSGFEVVADSLAVGCLLAYVPNIKSSWVFILPVFGITFLLNFPGYYSKQVYVTILIPLQNICIALSIAYCVANKGIVSNILNWKPITFIGIMSYSIYLWQQPFLNPLWNLPIVVRLILIAVCASASFYLVERPILRLRKTLESGTNP
ncbi:MAG: acyltransferase [Actinomycetota bacterium]